MRYSIVLKILGFIVMCIGTSMLLAVPWSFYYGDNDYTGILISAAITLAAGSFFFFVFNNNAELRPKEGFAIVTFSWILFSCFGSLPYILTGTIPDFTDAFFETMSGFTTTGATILTDIEKLPHGILFWRSLTNWIGGMGIILLSLAILPFLGVGGMQLYKAEVPGPMADKLKPRVTETAKILWGVYLLLTVAETVLLLFGGMNLFDSLCHSFGTLATGGYSTKNASIGHYDSAYIDYVIIVFMTIAGINFSLHYRLIRGDIKSFIKNKEMRFFLFIILIALILIGIDTYTTIYHDFFETLRKTLFQVISILTTTGFGTADYEEWSLSSNLILFVMMFIGGTAGSTGGGMKVLRVYILLKFAYTEIVKLLHPQAVVPVRIGKNSIDRKTVTNIIGFFVIYMMIASLGTLIMSFLGLELDTAMGAVAATLNNIGPGLGTVGPTENYAHMPAAAKWLLSFFMLLGRLEVFTVIILLAPSFWKK